MIMMIFWQTQQVDSWRVKMLLKTKKMVGQEKEEHTDRTPNTNTSYVADYATKHTIALYM